MKTTPLFFFLLFPVISQAQLHIQRLTIDPAIGVGFSSRPDQMLNPGGVFAAILTVETSTGWTFAPEAVATHFRDAVNREKVQFLFSEGYLRYELNSYGFRVGRMVRLDSSGKRLVFSAGLNSMEILEPIGLKGMLVTSVEKNSVHVLSVPIQVEFQMPFHPNGDSRLFLSARLNLNRYHVFPTIGIGFKQWMYRSGRRSVY